MYPLILRQRFESRELMDDFTTDTRMLWRTLEQFNMINKFISGIYPLLSQTIVNVMKQDTGRKYTILDLGAGAGDIAIWLYIRCKKFKIPVNIVCIDHDSRVVEFMVKRFLHYPDIACLCMRADDVLEQKSKYDFILSNHFLHHIPSAQIPDMIAKINLKCNYGFLVNDLKRSDTAYLLFKVFSPVFFHNSFTVPDGLTSIRKGFTIAEFSDFVSMARLKKQVVVKNNSLFHLYMWANKVG